jgi:hypothetical protein
MEKENKVLVELNRVISTFADRARIIKQVERNIPIWNYRQLIWLDEHDYSMQYIITVEDTGILNANFEHVVVYLILSEDAAVHYQLVWK